MARAAASARQRDDRLQALSRWRRPSTKSLRTSFASHASTRRRTSSFRPSWCATTSRFSITPICGAISRTSPPPCAAWWIRRRSGGSDSAISSPTNAGRSTNGSRPRRARSRCAVSSAREPASAISRRGPPRVLESGERIETGARRFRVIETGHVPHGWDASLLFEETDGTLFCSDLLGHGGDVEALCCGDIVGRSEAYNMRQQEGPMAGSVPYTHRTRPIIEQLADLEPKTLACMHGSSFAGEGGRVLREFGDVLERCFGPR